MKRIVSNLTVYWTFLTGIVCLFFIEILCASQINETFYALIHTANDQKGMSYVVAEKMTPHMYQLVELYMTDAERVVWKDSYAEDSEGNFILRKDKQFSDTLKDLEADVMVAQAVALKVYEMGDAGMERLVNEYTLLPTDHMEIRDILEEELYGEGDQAIKSASVRFVLLQLEKAGFDADTMVKRYKISCYIKLIMALFFMVISVIGAISLYLRAEDIIRGRMVDIEMRRAQLMIFGEAATLFECLTLILYSLYRLRRLDYVWLSTMGMIMVLIGLFLTWVLRTRPGFEAIYEKIALEAHLKGYMALVRNLVFFALPVCLLFFSLTGIFRRNLVYGIYGLISGILIILSGFIVAEIAVMADGVDAEILQDQDDLY